jgi:hypothetical protein
MAEYEKKVRQILKDYGCYFIREIRIRHVANGIMKQAGINQHF